MRIKRKHIIIGIILISFSLSNFNGDTPMPSSFFIAVLELFSELIRGFMRLIKLLLQFTLSWQGVLFIFVVLLYKAWKQYFDAKYNKK